MTDYTDKATYDYDFHPVYKILEQSMKQLCDGNYSEDCIRMILAYRTWDNCIHRLLKGENRFLNSINDEIYWITRFSSEIGGWKDNYEGDINIINTELKKYSNDDEYAIHSTHLILGMLNKHPMLRENGLIKSIKDAFQRPIFTF